MVGLHHHRIALKYKRLFSTPDGKAVLRDILTRCGYDQSSFDKDPYKTARNEGRREVALDILNLLNMDIQDIMTDL